MRRLLCLLPLLLAADWPHWRGPAGDGVSADGDPPVTWDAVTNVRWKTPIPGKGASTPVIVGDRLFVLTAVDTGVKGDVPKAPPAPPGADPDSPRYKRMTKPKGTVHRFLVLALDRHTGKELWRRTAAEKVPHEGTHDTHSYAAGSPVSDGERLYVSFGSFGTYAFTLDGNQLWGRDLGRLETRLGWGEAVTPAVHAGRVYVAHDHEGESFLVALDGKTGATLWTEKRDEPSAWTTPAVVPVKGRTLIVLPGNRKVRAYDAETGKPAWEAPGLTVNTIPTAIHRAGVVFAMSGYRDTKGGALDAATGRSLWTIDAGTPYVPSPLLAGDRLYFTSRNDPQLTSLNASTGKVVIDRARVTGLRQLYASPVWAAGRIYLPDRDGATAVLKDADRLEVLAVNKLGEGIDASPAVVGKLLYLRGEKHVWCIGAVTGPP
ncbi:MAG: PQQ-binding-like beta-propeller repeat protein [Gemmataceae bacterium]